MTDRDDRPAIPLPWDRVDRALACSLALLLAGFAFPWAAGWGTPRRVPLHFGFDGTPDRWGGPLVLALLPVVSFVLAAGLLLLARVPRIYNYPLPITPENAPRQYRLARRLVLVLANFVVASFLYVHLGTWRVAAGRLDGLSPVFVLAVVAGSAAIVLGYLVLAMRDR